MQFDIRKVEFTVVKPVLIVAISLLATHACADDAANAKDAAAGVSTQPLWEAGVFGIGLNQPTYPGAEDRTGRALVLPFLVYRGRYLRADRGSAGLRAFKTRRLELDVGFSGSLGSHSSGDGARSGMPDLGTMIEFGPRLKVNLGNIDGTRPGSTAQFSLREVIDISHGFRSRGIAFEPQWVKDMGMGDGWFSSATLGALFGDQTLNDTFYGVAPEYATAVRPSYRVRSGLIALRAQAILSHRITTAARIFYLLRLESLHESVNRDSPLFRRDFGWSAGVGVAWTWARSERSAFD